MSEKTQDGIGEQNSELLSKVLARLQDALFEPCAVAVGLVDEAGGKMDSDEESDQGVDLSQWNMPSSNSGAEFRERIQEFEVEHFPAFLNTSDEFTLEQTNIHGQFQSMFEDEIVSILQDEFGITNREFYMLLNTLQKNAEESELLYNGSAELLGLLHTILDFEYFCKDMKAKAVKLKGDCPSSSHK